MPAERRRESRRLRRLSTGAPIVVQRASQLGSGGEGAVYALAEEPDLVAKVYHQPTPERARKLEIMVLHPPEDPMADLNHRSFTWPVDRLVEDRQGGAVVGFLMPRVAGLRPLFDFYNPASRQEHAPLFNHFYLHRAARNLAGALGALHARGYVMGDVNESNVLIELTALVTVIDTDSFQVQDPESDATYRCRVGKPEFTPPELQDKAFASFDRTPEHDLFGLGVLIFQTLMEGTHPFAGVFQGSGDPPAIGARIAAGHLPLLRGRGIPYAPPPRRPPFDLLHPELRRLFLECFESGHHQAALRPGAASWQTALKEAESALVKCGRNDQHWFGPHCSACPWCERASAMNGRDPFPSSQAVARHEHRRPAPKRKAPRVLADAAVWIGPAAAPRVARPATMPSVWTGGPLPAAILWTPPAPFPYSRIERVFGLGCGCLLGAVAGIAAAPVVALLFASWIPAIRDYAYTFFFLCMALGSLVLGVRWALHPPRA